MMALRDRIASAVAYCLRRMGFEKAAAAIQAGGGPRPVK